MSKKIKIKELADRLGVSTATVSRALNDSWEISDTLKQRIRKFASEAGYKPNKIAANLRRGKTMTIGVVVPSISYNFNVKAIEGIEQVLGSNGYKVLIVQTMEKTRFEKEAIEYLLSNGVDGIILSIAAETRMFDHLNIVIEEGKPLVLMDRTTRNVSASEVVIDHEDASYDAVSHLLEVGCKKIAWIAGPKGLKLGVLRQRGYDKALEDWGIPNDQDLVCYCEFHSDMGFDRIRKFLIDRPDIDGIYAINDRFAIGAMGAIHSLKRKIPDDIAVVGFNNEPFDPLLNPSLTSVYQPSSKMGEEAAALILKHIKYTDLLPQRRMFKTKLIIRDSSVRR